VILSTLLLIPVVGALLIAFLPKHARDIAIASSLITLALGGLFTALFSYTTTAMQFVQEMSITHLLGIPISFHVGVDGISYPLILLTFLLGFVSILISKQEVSSNEPAYYAILLLLISGVTGVFVSIDLIFLFVCWEIVLVLMFLLILRWGHKNKRYAAMKFLMYTGVASAGLLLAIILLAVHSGSVSMLANHALIASGAQLLIFSCVLFTFLVKLPAVPFHTWLPTAHVEAPTAGSMLLAGVLLKLGGYGLLRFSMMLPASAQFRGFLFGIAILTILYGGFVCIAQYHLKRLIAYSSVNHMGLVLLGIAVGTPLGSTGAVFAMVSHGLIAALLFGVAGAMYQQTGTFELLDLRGLPQRLPKLAWLLLFAALAGMGIPLMTGFVAEFTVLLASFHVFQTKTIFAVFGVLLTGAYMVRLLGFTLFGAPRTNATDAHVRILPYLILVFMILLLGILPGLLIRMIHASPLT